MGLGVGKADSAASARAVCVGGRCLDGARAAALELARVDSLDEVGTGFQKINSISSRRNVWLLASRGGDVEFAAVAHDGLLIIGSEVFTPERRAHVAFHVPVGVVVDQEAADGADRIESRRILALNEIEKFIEKGHNDEVHEPDLHRGNVLGSSVAHGRNGKP